NLGTTATQPVTANPASLAGVVYVDANNDGIPEVNEVGIGGVLVTLTGFDILGDPVVATATTSLTGAYIFSGLRAGTYTLTESPPSSYVAGKTRVGSQGGSVTVPGQLGAIVLGSGARGTGYDFGEQPTADLALDASIDRATPNVGQTVRYT